MTFAPQEGAAPFVRCGGSVDAKKNWVNYMNCDRYRGISMVGGWFRYEFLLGMLDISIVNGLRRPTSDFIGDPNYG